jgi:uncharacterized membrane protein YhiD involved in acid resistance
MAFMHAFSASDFLDSLTSLFIAFVLGALIGAERQYRQRSGGLRTNALVAVGAAAPSSISPCGWPATTARCVSSPMSSPASVFSAPASS